MIPEFTDNTGRKWLVEMTVGALRRIRVATELKAGELLTDRKQLELFYSDDERAARVLFELCKPDEPFEKWIERLNGDALREGRDAVMEAAANFTLRPEISAVFRETWRSDQRTNAQTLATTMRENTVETESSESAGNLPGSLESTLAS